MRLTPLVLPALLTGALLAAPRPRLTVYATFGIAPDSTVAVTATIYLQGSLATTDSLRWSLQKDAATVHALTNRSLTFRGSAAAPDYGATSSYRVCGQVKRGSSLVGSQVCSAAWSYARPSAPAPTIDSLIITPAAFRVELVPSGQAPTAKNQQQMCAFVGFRSGHVGFRRAAEGTIAYCDSLYRALPLSVRMTTPSEQAVADTICVRWSATGGTVSGESCAILPRGVQG